MTWGIRARRRAEEFATLVEQGSTGAGGPRSGGPRSGDDVAASRDGDLLELVGALRAVPEAQPRPEFVADLRTRLLAEAETALVPDDLARLRLPARHTSRERRLAAIVGGIAIVGATTSVAVASQSALPGESLYPIKRALESAHAGLSVGEARKGGIGLASAADRLDEATALARSEDAGSQARVAPTLSTFSDQATRGADLLFADYAHHDRDASIAQLRNFASASLDQLEALEPLVPTDARDELVAAANVVAQIDAEAAQQCPDCGGTPIEAFPPSLVSAPAIELPTVPETAVDAGARGDATKGQGKGGDKDGKDTGKDSAGAGDQGASTGTTGGGTDLPDVGDVVPPGSVLDPTTAPSPSATTDPVTKTVKALTDGLTGALTGGGATAKATPTDAGSATPTTAPLTGVVEGVTEILQGVLNPVTGSLLPPQ
jgi:hypothetical protein